MDKDKAGPLQPMDKAEPLQPVDKDKAGPLQPVDKDTAGPLQPWIRPSRYSPWMRIRPSAASGRWGGHYAARCGECIIHGIILVLILGAFAAGTT
jgi:hypothetical protein